MTDRFIIENIAVPASVREGADAEALGAASAALSRMAGKAPSFVEIRRKSVDARHKNEVRFVYSVNAGFDGLTPADEEKLIAAGCRRYSAPSFSVSEGKEKPRGDLVIVGFGPAGMFCALELAERGYRPVVYERGSSVGERVAKVGVFLRGGALDPECNVQFGAGGAGTFSDGKLTTRINDPAVSYVLKRLTEFGAPDDVIWKARPHIGTDLLREIVASVDGRIRSLGGTIRYDTAVRFRDGAVEAAGERIGFGALVLAVGHSARDTYRELLDGGFAVAPKPFSAGVRIEHPQEWLDRAMYGDLAGDGSLGHAEYSLSYRSGERGAYSFCMCPGGTVIASSSEEGGVVTNGMSSRKRDGRQANAALAVSVLPENYGNTPTGAIEFQRSLERAAFRAGGCDYSAPVQLVGDFISKTPSVKLGSIEPTYMDGRVVPCDLRSLFPGFIGDMLEAGLGAFDEKIPGFAGWDVPLTGVETRTSSPVRILRGDTLEALGHPDVYPCGEGAGYAGGIVSAAVDGLRVAKAIIERFSHE